MSRFFGDAIQVSYVVRDIGEAMYYWATALGIGPWFYLPHLDVPDFQYHERPSPVDLSLALAYSGPLQVELIQQHNAVPSLYHDAIATYGYGAHHLGYGSTNFDSDLRLWQLDGYRIAQYGTGGVRGPFVYLDILGIQLQTHPGTIIEVMDLAHGRAELFAGIAAAARGWDGSDPIRTRLPIEGQWS